MIRQPKAKNKTQGCQNSGLQIIKNWFDVFYTKKQNEDKK